jgi:integrase
MALSDVKIRNAKAKEKAYKLADERGLYLLVTTTGSKLWRFDYRHAGKRKTLAIGNYPDRSLRKAWESRDEARRLLSDGIDPAAAKRDKKADGKAAAANTYEAVAREWLEKQPLSVSTRAKALWMLESHALPWIGKRAISDIRPPEMLDLLRRIERSGKLETAQRVKQQAGRIFRYAVATGRASDDPTAALRGALKTPITRHRASITDPKLIGPLLRVVEGYRGSFVTACALKLAPLLFVRPGELRHAEWSEFDFDAATWRIPAAKMKMGAVHIVPLSAQSLAVLRELQPLTGAGRFVFPGIRGRGRPMSENNVLGALRRLGYSGDEMTGHGFRSMASTRLHEMGWPHEAIERQLAHAQRDQVSAAYNYAEHLPERRKMMQAWADYLDVLREDRKVVAGQFGRAA